MIDIDIKSIPNYFRFCLNDKCPRANECLHHEAGVYVMKKGAKSMLVFNPMLMADRDENCEDFVTSKMEIYYKGLLHFMGKVPSGRMNEVKEVLIRCIGSQRQFYRVKNGEILVSPEKRVKWEREINKIGLEIPLFFDENIETYAFK